MEQFTEEYIKNVRDIIKNKDTDKAKELLNGLHPCRYSRTISGNGSGRSRIYLHASRQRESG